MKGVHYTIALWICCWIAFSQPEKEVDIATGSIEGTVMLASQQSQVQVGGGNRYGRPSNNSTSQSPEDSVLVWLINNDHNTPDVDSPETPVILNQTDLKFNPSLIPIRQHGTIRIRNSDPVYHNVFSLSSTKKFDVGRRPKDEYMDVTFDKPGIVDVFCDIHSNMHAVIYVMPPDAMTWLKVEGGKSFTLQDIPEGNYELNFYARGYEERSISVEVKPQETVNIGTINLTS